MRALLLYRMRINKQKVEVISYDSIVICESKHCIIWAKCVVNAMQKKSVVNVRGNACEKQTLYYWMDKHRISGVFVEPTERDAGSYGNLLMPLWCGKD